MTWCVVDGIFFSRGVVFFLEGRKKILISFMLRLFFLAGDAQKKNHKKVTDPNPTGFFKNTKLYLLERVDPQHAPAYGGSQAPLATVTL